MICERREAWTPRVWPGALRALSLWTCWARAGSAVELVMGSADLVSTNAPENERIVAPRAGGWRGRRVKSEPDKDNASKVALVMLVSRNTLVSPGET